MIAKAYESKKEEIISAIVTKTDISTGNVVVDTGTSEAVLLKSEQIPGEVLEVGKHVKVFVTIPEPKVEEMREGRDAKDGKEKRGPVVTLSRTNPNFVKRLFEMEIPEIADGTVVINNVSREPGSRTKISVSSRNADVDAVGACIGTNGMRINKIVAEINNEKIDVVNYSELPEEYVKAALSPAKTISITPDPTRDRAYRVIVAPDQLSLAIGKAGQNVRLAARLTGFKIDIKDSAE
jgi:N utilization substance protein A